jgi:hypothetical protein
MRQLDWHWTKDTLTLILRAVPSDVTRLELADLINSIIRDDRHRIGIDTLPTPSGGDIIIHFQYDPFADPSACPWIDATIITDAEHWQIFLQQCLAYWHIKHDYGVITKGEPEALPCIAFGVKTDDRSSVLRFQFVYTTDAVDLLEVADRQGVKTL